MISNGIKTIILSLLLVSLSACVNTKKLNIAWVFKKQVIYEGSADSNGRSTMTRDSITRPLIAKIEKRDSILVFTVYEGNLKRNEPGRNVSGMIHKGLFFPYIDSIPRHSSVFVQGKKLLYLTSNPVFQALTIPLKVRFSTGSNPYEAEGSINFGVAFGWKFTHHVYRNYYHGKTGQFVNSTDNHYSITPGIFIGPGVVELTPQNSNSPNDRNVMSFTYGTMLVFGLNRLNIGIALGFDNAVGNADKNWIYQAKPWLGATISFDLIQ